MKILVVEDDALMQATLKSVFREFEVTVASSHDAALVALQNECFSAAFLDINLKLGTPGNGIELLRKIRERDAYLPCVMISGLQDRNVILNCLDLGAVDYIIKAEGGPDVYRLALVKAMSWRKIFSESRASRSETRGQGIARGDFEIKGVAPVVKQLRQTLGKLGQMGGPFLILGETGSGKELAARALWSVMGDKNRPFIALNCASLPENLVESELFGYEKGAFTGALSTKTGLFEAANGGDIFLDEIGELSPDLQAKLLRVLQEKKVRRLGSDRERPVDFRVIAATHLDILAAVRDGDFREDLFYRINVHQIQIPPLRERRGDIAGLLRIFWDEAGLPGCRLEETAREIVDEFSWPGNVRQLRAFAHFVIPYLETASPVVTVELVEKWIAMNRVKSEDHGIAGDPAEEVRAALREKKPLNLVAKLDALQRRYVQAALDAEGGNRSRAAKILGVSRQRLSNWLNEWEAGPG